MFGIVGWTLRSNIELFQTSFLGPKPNSETPKKSELLTVKQCSLYVWCSVLHVCSISNSEGMFEKFNVRSYQCSACCIFLVLMFNPTLIRGLQKSKKFGKNADSLYTVHTFSIGLEPTYNLHTLYCKWAISINICHHIHIIISSFSVCVVYSHTNTMQK